MKIADHLSNEQKQKLENLKSPRGEKRNRKNSTNPKIKKKKEEKLSFKDYEFLMGQRMPTLHRKRGGALGN